MQRFPCLTTFFALIVCLCLESVAAAELTIVHVDFGFDGHVVQEAFNLVTVEIQNNGKTAWEGQLILQEGFEDSLRVESNLYVEPGGRRIVQFTPFVEYGGHDWRLRWGKTAAETQTFDLPFASQPAQVAFIDPQGLRMSATSNFRRFDERLFPTTVAGTAGLAEAILDHSPRWDSLRQRAFMDWLSCGGILHLVKGIDGRYPQFTGELQPLNDLINSNDSTAGKGRFIRFQAGKIVRHEIALTDFSRDSFLNPPFDPDSPEGRLALPGQSRFGIAMTGNQMQMMRELTRPNMKWGRLYAMAIIFLLCLFPGCWLVGRKQKKFGVTYASILGTTAVFSYGFRTVGARGYDEQTILHSVAIARPVTEGIEFRQWTSLFVTNSGQYELKHSGIGAGDIRDQGKGTRGAVIANPPQIQMITDIPPFSSRAIVTQGRINQTPPQLQVNQFQRNGNSVQLQATLDGIASDQVLNVNLAITGSQGEYLEIPVHFEPATKLLAADGSLQANQQDQYNNGWNEFSIKRSWPAFTDGSRRVLALMGTNAFNPQQPQTHRGGLREERIRILVLANMPDVLFPDTNAKALKKGVVLYSFDVHPQGKSQTADEFAVE